MVNLERHESKSSGILSYPLFIVYGSDFEGRYVLMFVHAAVAALAAVVAGAFHAAYRRTRHEDEPIQFTLRGLMTELIALALALGIVSCLNVPPLVYVGVTLMFAGWPASLMLAGRIYRRRARDQKLTSRAANREFTR